MHRSEKELQSDFIVHTHTHTHVILRRVMALGVIFSNKINKDLELCAAVKYILENVLLEILQLRRRRRRKRRKRRRRRRITFFPDSPAVTSIATLLKENKKERKKREKSQRIYFLNKLL